jgi:hypothetical protein
MSLSQLLALYTVASHAEYEEWVWTEESGTYLLYFLMAGVLLIYESLDFTSTKTHSISIMKLIRVMMFSKTTAI